MALRSVPPLDQQLPPPPRLPGSLFAVLRALRADPLSFLSSVRRDHGDVVEFRILIWRAVLVTHPDGVRHVLQERHTAYSKDNVDYRMLKPVLGEGLVTSDGDFWRRQRRLIQPAFHRERIAGLGDLMTARTALLLERWAPLAAQGAVIDVAEEMSRLALDIVARALFRVDVASTMDRIGEAVTILNRHVSARFDSPIGLLLAGVPPLLPRARRALRTLDEVVYGIIREHRRGTSEGGDLLSTLLDLRDEETGEGMSDRQVRDEVMTLLLAGHETTANALAWTWHLLAQHPAVAARLRAELAGVLGGRVPTVADLPQLPFTRMVLEEAMRLYPPAWIISRAAKDDDAIGGYHVPRGTTVVLCPWVTHRHPDFWPDPERFEPERFAPDRVPARPRFAYFPFGGGPRLCIGAGFAMTEAQLVLASVASRYRLEPVAGKEPILEPLVTLRPRDGLAMRVQPV